MQCFYSVSIIKTIAPRDDSAALSDLVRFEKRIRNNLRGLKDWRNTAATGLSYVATAKGCAKVSTERAGKDTI